MNAPREVREIGPQPGPQTAFLASEADIAFYGGAAGGGKTWALVFDAGRGAHLNGYAAVIFRRTSPQLTGGGSIWEEAQGLYPLLGGRAREHPTLDWHFHSGAMIECRHLQHEKNKLDHQGKQYGFIGFDEATHFTESQFWYLVSRSRSTSGVLPYIRATCNPDPDSFVRGLIDWWIGQDGLPIPDRSGVLRWFVRDGDDLHWFPSKDEALEEHPDGDPMSITFIAAKLEDNPALLEKDPTYRAKLRALNRIDRQRLELGNWDVRASAGELFQRHWFKLVDAVADVPGRVVRTVRCWDKAATEPHAANPDPDWTVGAKLSVTSHGFYVLEHVERLRKRPAGVDDAMRAIAEQDGRGVEVGIWQDPGQAGVVDVEHTKGVLRGWAVTELVASRDKTVWAKVWSPLAEQGLIYVVRGRWNNVVFATLENFPPEDGGHDDDVDAISLAFQMLYAGLATKGARRPNKEGRPRVTRGGALL